MLAFVQWLESTSGSIAIHESIWAYPIIESVHVLALCLFLGLAIIIDLRLLGVSFRGTPVSELMDRLLPWNMAGFAMMVASGVLLFYAAPVKTYLNIFFRLKVVFLLMAAINAAVFQIRVSPGRREWDYDAAPPFGARLAGGVSNALWAAIVVAGRMIAYNWFDQDPSSLVQ